MVDHSDNTWPPGKLTCFTPLLLIHRQGGHCTPQQVTAMAELMYKGDIGKVTMVPDGWSTIKYDKLDGHEKFHKMLDANRSSATKEIEEILAPLEKSNESAFILIEGAPGIGKSVLLKEIAYKWGNKQLLKQFDLVLLVSLRDPILQQIKSVSNLLQLFYKGDEDAIEVVRACSEYLSKNGGKTLTLLLDGYDEYPEHLQKSSLIADIIKRQVLPLCGLVVSSRPHASQHLRELTTIRVDILGFTETEREHYITQINHTKSKSSHNTFINDHLLIASALAHSTWSSCFICTNWEFHKIPPSYTIILSVLPFVDIFPNLVILLHIQSLTLPTCLIPTIE